MITYVSVESLVSSGLEDFLKLVSSRTPIQSEMECESPGVKQIWQSSFEGSRAYSGVVLILSLPFHQRTMNVPFTSDADCLMHSHSSLDYHLLSSCHMPGTVFSDRNRQFLSGVGVGAVADPPWVYCLSSRDRQHTSKYVNKMTTESL